MKRSFESSRPGSDARWRTRRPEPLRPGPGLQPDAVAADQRARLEDAITELVYERGYPAVTVRELLARAHVSRPTFYRLFDGKEDCFFSAYRRAADQALRWTAAATEGSVERDELVARGAEAFCAAVALNPAAASLVLLEPMAVGRPARDEMHRVEAEFAALLRRRYGELGQALEIPRTLSHGMISGIGRVARWRLNEGDPTAFAEDIREVVHWSAAVSEVEALARLKGTWRRSNPVESPQSTPLPTLAADDDRSLLVNAAIRIVAKHGYGSLEVTEIAAAAGVTRSKFESSFASLDDCFSAAIELAAAAVMGRATAAYQAASPGALGIARAIEAVVDYLASTPGIARVLFVEIFRPGRTVTRRSAGILSALAGLLVRRLPEDVAPSAQGAEASVGAIWSLIRREVEEDRVGRLRELVPTFVWIALAPCATDALLEVSEAF